eukprot:COSAG03_NODE_21960_length_297_cov_0.722222_1_plen_32_part_10
MLGINTAPHAVDVSIYNGVNFDAYNIVKTSKA